MDTKSLVAGAGLALGVVAAWYLAFHQKDTHKKRVFVLAVRLTLNPAFPCEGGKTPLQTFLDAWEPLARHCQEQEPETLSYEACVGEEDPNEIIIYERYTTKSALTDVHHKSSPFLAFGKALNEGALKGLVAAKSRATYYESNVGYMSRA